MRRRLALAGAALLLAGTTSLRGGTGPRIRVEPGSFDFGRVRPGSTLRKEFRLRNLGDERLVIERISRSCGCTRAEAGSMSVEPGDSTPLLVELKTRNAAGEIRHSVTVRCNDPETPLLEIPLSATVVADTSN